MKGLVWTFCRGFRRLSDRRSRLAGRGRGGSSSAPGAPPPAPPAPVGGLACLLTSPHRRRASPAGEARSMHAARALPPSALAQIAYVDPCDMTARHSI